MKRGASSEESIGMQMIASRPSLCLSTPRLTHIQSSRLHALKRSGAMQTTWYANHVVCKAVKPAVHTLGCNNGIGGFNENLVTFRGTKLPDFLLAQKTRLKKCSF